jgi:hypothetical protein
LINEKKEIEEKKYIIINPVQARKIKQLHNGKQYIFLSKNIPKFFSFFFSKQKNPNGNIVYCMKFAFELFEHEAAFSCLVFRNFLLLFGCNELNGKNL